MVRFVSGVLASWASTVLSNSYRGKIAVRLRRGKNSSVPVRVRRRKGLFRLAGRGVDCVVRMLRSNDLKGLCFKGGMTSEASFDRLVRSTCHPGATCTDRGSCSFSERRVHRRFPICKAASFHRPTVDILRRGNDHISTFRIGKRTIRSNGGALIKLPTACIRSPRRTAALRVALRSSLTKIIIILDCALCRSHPIIAESIYIQGSKRGGIRLRHLLDVGLSLPSTRCRLLRLSKT